MGDDPVDPKLTWDVGGEIANAVTNELVKAVAVVHGVDPLTASMLGGGVGGLAKSLAAGAQRAYERRRARAAMALEAAGAATLSGRQRLLERAMDDDRKLELLVRAIEAATREADEQRVRFYGRIAAEGILSNDDAVVDISTRVFSAIASLDAIDVKVLLHMQELDRFERPRDETPYLPDAESLAVDLPELADVTESVIARLQTAGLLAAGYDVTLGYSVTKFGQRCIADLLAAGAERPES